MRQQKIKIIEEIEEIENKDLVHLACHGVFDSDFGGSASRILLADKSLMVGEIFNLELNSALTTLSACEIGLAKLTKGDEVEGFIGAFLYAGLSRNNCISMGC